MTRALRHEWHSLLYDPAAGLSMVAKVVGCALIEHADRDGVAWPGLPELAAHAGVASRHTVLKGLAELEARGLLMVERRSGRVNRYRLVLPEPTSAPDARVPVQQPVHEPVHDVHPNQGTSGTRGRAHARRSPGVSTEWLFAHAAELDAADGDER